MTPAQVPLLGMGGVPASTNFLASLYEFVMNFEMAPSVSEFHMTYHLLCWDLRGGAANSPSHVLYTVV